jgi:hypothetical protein
VAERAENEAGFKADHLFGGAIHRRHHRFRGQTLFEVQERCEVSSA